VVQDSRILKAIGADDGGAPLLAPVVSHVIEKVNRTLATHGDRFPHYTEAGCWIWTEDGRWTGGLWVGQLWIAYLQTGDTKYATAAWDLLPILEARIERDDANFDLGFVLVPSFVTGYRILGEQRLRQVALRGADRMLDFFSEKAGLLYTVYPEGGGSTVAIGKALIDIMPNLALLWWASGETGDPKYYNVARLHAERTRELLVRPDGSTFQVVDFELNSGKILNRGTIHGYSNGSTWARGQAWGATGFALAYRAVQSDGFRATAETLSRYFMNRLPEDGRAYWDLADPAIPACTRDSSASAIMACGWLKMGGDWPMVGRRLIETLANRSLTENGCDGILSHGTAHKVQGRGLEQTTVWGDYFFMQGLAGELVKDVCVL